MDSDGTKRVQKLQHKLDWMVWHQSRNRIDDKKPGIQSIKIKFS
jgi:hypothetical protein